MKLLNNLIISWQIIHNGIPKEPLLVKKVNSVEEICTLSEKVDALMKLVASKNAPIDLNDVSLSTLIEQNSDSVDVNFVSRNNFNNNAYIEAILILGLFLEIPIIIMVILITIIIERPLILRIILNNLSMLKNLSILR